MRRTLAVIAVLALPACGEPARAADDEVAAARAALEQGDASAALRLARARIAGAGDDVGADPAPAAAYQVLAEAAFRLDRLGEAITAGEQGLALEGLDPDERADLQWIVGMAALQRHRQLGDDADRSKANVALEHATRAGTHRLVAAAALAIMNVDRDEQRFVKFASLVVREWPDAPEAEALRAALRARGVDPPAPAPGATPPSGRDP